MLSEIAYANHVGDFVLDTGHLIQLGNRDQRALGTLPPCRFPISQRGLLGQTGRIPGSKISGGVQRQCYLPLQVCHTVMPLRNVSAELLRWEDWQTTVKTLALEAFTPDH